MTDRVDSPWQGKWPTKKNKTLQVTSLKVTYYKFKRKNKTNKKKTWYLKYMQCKYRIPGNAIHQINITH